MPFADYLPWEIEFLREAVYRKKIKPLVEPTEFRKFVVIYVESGDYEIGERALTSWNSQSWPNYQRSRNLAGNPDSPQTVVFITSIIDEIAGVST